MFCPVSLAITIAIEDSIFADVKTVKEIFHPKIPPIKHHILIMHSEAVAKPILCSEIFDGLIWITSPARALTYNALADHVTCYCCQHGASNCISHEMTTQDWTTLMSHVEGSKKFDNYYKTRLIDADLRAIFQGQDANVQYVEAAKTSSSKKSMATMQTPCLPVMLSLSLSTICYPGEGLTDDSKCTIGKHLYDCLQKCKSTEAQDNTNNNYQPNLYEVVFWTKIKFAPFFHPRAGEMQGNVRKHEETGGNTWKWSYRVQSI
ncbi:hypothetical protein IW261DRAFT_1423706 [Armillaria novae-zelandiae]|uniref:Uncharacterized protein n=1 Tax=Armillaria novae-zelandiae TaxID=153914 RepID=A0AA39NWI0_9AGAR|nr:hypothetical protein IW261DRAFT_1423706 [Armillaria novae-zelandiae]